MTPMTKLRWALAAVAAVAVLAVAGPYVYIHWIEGDPPARLSLEDATTSTSTTAAASTATRTGIDGTWTVATGSQAGYRVKEVLFGQDTEGVGRTEDVTGTVAVEGTTVTAAEFEVDMTTITSDEERRDGQFQGRIMDTAQFPTASFKITRPIALGAAPADGATVTRQVTGDLTLHGVTRSVTFSASIKKTGAGVAVSGSIPVLFADYNIQNPSFAGVVTTDDHGILEFLLDFSPA